MNTMHKEYIPNVIAIVVTYNGERFIDRCLLSLLNCSLINHVIVVDNCSTDNTKMKVNRYSVEKIYLTENIGFGAANNIGIKNAIRNKADYIFLLNQDAWIEKNTIRYIVEMFDRKPEYGIMSPIHVSVSGNKLDYMFSKCLCPDNTPDYYSDLYGGNLKKVYETKFTNAAAWMISSECIKKIGGFDPIFFLYGEDEEFAMRTRRNGFKIGIVTDAIIYHDRTPKRISETKIKRYRAVQIYRLIDRNNILAKEFVRHTICNIINVFKMVMRGDLDTAMEYVKILSELVFKMPSIVRSRYSDKKNKIVL